jgi:serine/threonine-protein kinase
MLGPGTTVGRYVIQKKLAEGGMAEIWLASAVGPEGFSKDVVIKVVRSFLSSDSQFVQMFIAEARLASKLNHANVVQIFDFGKHDETYYLAMEYVRGASLWDLRKRCKQSGVAFPPTLAAEIIAQVARGLQYAHGLSEGGQKIGVVHRDVTPHNVLLSFDGAVKLTDFGIAKATSSQTAPGMLKGKFAYMSPEQSRGEKVDARTDIFALGVVLWELLTGGRLFDGDSDVAVLRAVQESVIVPPERLNPDVPHDLSEIVMKALARVPDERFQRAFDLERALANYVLQHAQSMDDTAVGPFVQAVFHEQFEPAPPQPPPALEAPADDFGVGSTHFANRNAPEPEMTMTGTPIRPVPAHATPKPTMPERVGLADVDPQARKTTQLGAIPTEPPQPRSTEQQPAVRAGPTSRRFDPLPKIELSAIIESKTVDPRQPAAPAVTPTRSPVPMVLGGVLVVGLLGGVGYAAFGATNEPPPRLPAAVTETRPIMPRPAPIPDEVPSVAVADAPPLVDAGPADEPDAAVVMAVAAPLVKVDKPVEAVKPKTASRAMGALRITNAIPYAMVAIDNARAPVEAEGTKVIAVTAGPHEIELTFKGKKRKSTVLIKPNEIVTITAGEE